MNTPTARPIHRRTPAADQPRLRLRAELPAIATDPGAARWRHATHDFLVPNPRPDLIDLRDHQTIEEVIF